MYGSVTKYIGIKYSLKKNEDVFRVFQRPFVCMNAPEINQTAREWRNYFCEYFSWGYGLNNTKPAKLITYNLTKL